MICGLWKGKVATRVVRCASPLLYPRRRGNKTQALGKYTKLIGNKEGRTGSDIAKSLVY